MILHICPTLGTNCGIALFAEKIQNELPDTFILSSGSFLPAEAILLQHEYAVHERFPWDLLDPGKEQFKHRAVYMHSLTDTNYGHERNKHINRWASDIIVSTDAMVREASSLFSGKVIYKIPHFSEPLIGPFKPLDTNKKKITIGIHGFATWKSGFIKMIRAVIRYNRYVRTPKDPEIALYVLGPLSNVTAGHLFESREYVDDCMERIRAAQDVEINYDTTYYKSKSEVAHELRKNVDVAFVPQRREFVLNTSGAVRVTLSAGIPVITPDYSQFDGIPENVIGRISDSHEDELIEGMKNIKEITNKIDPQAVSEYIESTDIKHTSKSIANIFIDNAD